MIGTQIDWNEVWKDKMNAVILAAGGYDCAGSFDNQASAKSYWQMVQEAQDLIEMMINGMEITPDSAVLDVGAGPGTLAYPLARRVSRITAVEPAGAMADILLENVKGDGLGNVDHVGKKWEDVDPEKDLAPPYDIVVASFSLGMADIREAVKKMVQVSSKYIYLFWFAGPPSWERDFKALAQGLDGSDYPGQPKSEILFNVLYQMGIYPNVEVFPARMNHRYPSLEHMVEEYSVKMNLETDEKKAVVRDYFRTVTENHEDDLVLPYTWNTMKIWWKK
ncbi:MAG: class I SAM-dependent methyltransferase [Desulfobacteraceae bacterium]|nr:class I SAM-dependent methyltransferase [Desulfobacteraceae bacterium]